MSSRPAHFVPDSQDSSGRILRDEPQTLLVSHTVHAGQLHGLVLIYIVHVCSHELVVY